MRTDQRYAPLFTAFGSASKPPFQISAYAPVHLQYSPINLKFSTVLLHVPQQGTIKTNMQMGFTISPLPHMKWYNCMEDYIQASTGTIAIPRLANGNKKQIMKRNNLPILKQESRFDIQWRNKIFPADILSRDYIASLLHAFSIPLFQTIFPVQRIAH